MADLSHMGSNGGYSVPTPQPDTSIWHTLLYGRRWPKPQPLTGVGSVHGDMASQLLAEFARRQAEISAAEDRPIYTAFQAPPVPLGAQSGFPGMAGMGGQPHELQFNPNARLDTSQVQDMRGSTGLRPAPPPPMPPTGTTLPPQAPPLHPLIHQFIQTQLSNTNTKRAV